MMTTTDADKDYFKAARDWHFDRYHSVKINANRWFVAFMVANSLLVLLAAVIAVLLPLKTLVPLVIHQNTTTGEVWVDRPTTAFVPVTDAQTQADIVRYIVSRESYMAADLNQRYDVVMLLSNNAVAQAYAQEQSNSNKESPVNQWGAEGTQTVHIEDIVFLDKAGLHTVRHFHEPSQNLAKVDFTTTTTDAMGRKSTGYWVATISWIYKGLPNNEQDAWDNWDGFTVTAYRVDPRNISTASTTN